MGSGSVVPTAILAAASNLIGVSLIILIFALNLLHTGKTGKTTHEHLKQLRRVSLGAAALVGVSFVSAGASLACIVVGPTVFHQVMLGGFAMALIGAVVMAIWIVHIAN